MSEMKELIAKVRRQLAEMNADLETLAVEYGVETEANMATRGIQHVGEARVPKRRIELEFIARL